MTRLQIVPFRHTSESCSYGFKHTTHTFTTVIDDSNQDLRHKLAGQTIYLSMRGVVPDGYKYAVSDCSIVTETGTKFMLMEPGAATGATGWFCEHFTIMLNNGQKIRLN